MARRRGQRKGYLFERCGKWILQWREDVIEDGKLKRPKFARIIAESEGPDGVGKRQAQRIAWDETLSKLDNASTKPASIATMRDFIVRHYEPEILWRKGRKESGRRSAAAIVKNHLLDWRKDSGATKLGDRRMRDIDANLLQALISQKAEALSPQSCRHIKNQISAIFNHAKRRGYFSGENPASLLILPQMTRKHRRALTWEQVDALAARLTESRPLIYLLAVTGLRIGEACGLRWRHLNLTDQAVMRDGLSIPPMAAAILENWVANNVDEKRVETKSLSADRLIPLPTALVFELAAHRQRSRFAGDEDPVFAGRSGRPIDAGNLLNRHFKPAAEELGIGWANWHCLRHTATTFADQVGMTLTERQKGMGHSAGTQTMDYSHADVESMRRGLEKVAGRLRGMIQ